MVEINVVVFRDPSLVLLKFYLSFVAGGLEFSVSLAQQVVILLVASEELCLF